MSISIACLYLLNLGDCYKSRVAFGFFFFLFKVAVPKMTTLDIFVITPCEYAVALGARIILSYLPLLKGTLGLWHPRVTRARKLAKSTCAGLERRVLDIAAETSIASETGGRRGALDGR